MGIAKENPLGLNYKKLQKTKMKGGSKLSDSSGSEEDSGSGSSGSESGSSSSSEERHVVKPSRRPGASSSSNNKAKGKVDWRKDPELYGIRRSGRARKEPASGSGSSEDSSPRK